MAYTWRFHGTDPLYLLCIMFPTTEPARAGCYSWLWGGWYGLMNDETIILGGLGSTVLSIWLASLFGKLCSIKSRVSAIAGELFSNSRSTSKLDDVMNVRPVCS